MRSMSANVLVMISTATSGTGPRTVVLSGLNAGGVSRRAAETDPVDRGDTVPPSVRGAQSRTVSVTQTRSPPSRRAFSLSGGVGRGGACPAGGPRAVRPRLGSRRPLHPTVQPLGHLPEHMPHALARPVPVRLSGEHHHPYRPAVPLHRREHPVGLDREGPGIVVGL